MKHEKEKRLSLAPTKCSSASCFPVFQNGESRRRETEREKEELLRALPCTWQCPRRDGVNGRWGMATLRESSESRGDSDVRTLT